MNEKNKPEKNTGEKEMQEEKSEVMNETEDRIDSSKGDERKGYGNDEIKEDTVESAEVKDSEEARESEETDESVEVKDNEEVKESEEIKEGAEVEESAEKIKPKESQKKTLDKEKLKESVKKGVSKARTVAEDLKEEREVKAKTKELKDEGEQEAEEEAEEEVKKEIPIEKIAIKKPRRKIEGEEKRLFKFALTAKKKKPKFSRQELHKKKKLADVWRTPRGIDSKQIEKKRGKGKVPMIGYKKPRIVSGLHPSGYTPVHVYNLAGLDSIDNKSEAAVISAGIGRKKRNEIIKFANEKSIAILNPRKGELL